MQLKLALIGRECRGQLVRPMDATAIDHHNDFFPDLTEDSHDLMHILPKVLRIKMGRNFIEDPRGAVLHSANDMEQYPIGDATPGAIVCPGLSFERLFPFDLAVAQGACGQPIALRSAPPPSAGQGKTPDYGLIFIEQDALALARPVLQGGQFETSVGQLSGVGLEPTRGATVAQRVFFRKRRMLSRPSWTPVWWASTVASSRQLHCEWIDPCVSGS